MMGGGMGKIGAIVAVVALTAACGDSTSTSRNSSTETMPTSDSVEADPSTSVQPECVYNDREVNPPLESAVGALTVSPFDLSKIRMFVNGAEGPGMDARFSYVLIAQTDDLVPIYAPAPMLLVKMRFKDGFAMQRTREPGDWDFTFLVDCNTQIRINHISQPDATLLAAYGYGDEPGTYWNAAGEQTDDESKMIPTTEIVLQPGDLIGYTQGTQNSNFDFVMGVNELSVCPWEQFAEPVRTELLAKLGPIPGAPDDGPEPGYACVGYGGHM